MIALARTYRPRRFADLLVQDHVAAALRGAVARERVGHGYLLTGPRGVGKTTAARILAMALNCERPDAERGGEPCGECPTCERIWSGSANLDVVEIDAASNRSVDDARDLRERAMYAASNERRYKVYIVDEAHMLTREAWNALLKILEEPPPRVVFVFATTEPQKIANMAAPVLSRLQRFDFKRIGAAAIRARLEEVLAEEGLEADEDALALIARYADGGMRDALSILDQVLSLSEGPLEAERVREALGLIGEETYARVLRAVADRDAAKIFPIVDEVTGSGADLVEFINGLAEMLRAVLMTQTGARPEGLTAAARDAVAEATDRLVPGDALRMLALLADAETAIRRSSNGRLVVETLLLRWALMDRTVDLEAVLAASPPGPRTGQAAARPFADRESPAPRQASGPAKPPPTAGPAVLPRLVEELTLDALVAAWPDVTARCRQTSPLAGAVLDAMVPAAVEGTTVRLRVLSDDAHMAEGARRHQKTIEGVVAEAVGRAVRVELGEADRQSAPSERPKRLSATDLRDERLSELRGIDPALDAAADALDLEIVD